MDDSKAFETGGRKELGGSVPVLDSSYTVQAQKENIHEGGNGKPRDAIPPSASFGVSSEEKKTFIKKSANWLGKFVDETRPILNPFHFHLAWKLTLKEIASVRGGPKYMQIIS